MAKRKKSQSRGTSGQRELHPHTRRLISATLQLCLGIVFLLALRDEAGVVGARINGLLTALVGAYGFLLPLGLIISGAFRLFDDGKRLLVKRSVGLALSLLSLLGLAHLGLPFDKIWTDRGTAGGNLGFLVSFPFMTMLSPSVGTIVLGSLFLVGIFLAFEPDVAAIMAWAREHFAKPAARTVTRAAKAVRAEEEEDDIEEEDDDDDLVEDDIEAPELNIVRPSFAQANVSEPAPKPKPKPKDVDGIQMTDTRYEEWTFPALDLLETNTSVLTVNDEELKSQAKLIEAKLAEFDIAVTVRDARPGPTVTQFTLQPSEGVKLSRIGNLKDDLALALAAPSLRIEAPIPGKSLVGIEMPNLVRSTVHLREIMDSTQFQTSKSPLTFPLGRDVSGESVVASLESMPHLLIAGATGSGKSVCMNVFLTSLLFQNAPHQLKLILIDPKRVELMPYNGIPHLLTPVITEADTALKALRWAVQEMGRRLHRFSEQGARNLDEYNEKQADESTMLPRIVIVVDELADLMMRQFKRDTETMIVRIAQMARAVGMHLIIATQRPSVDVITGLIKANIPTRIAFRVVSSVDSRTILDGIGAEDLLGKGDMLYMTANTPKPIRIQGIYVATKEVERVINAVKIAGGGAITEQIGLGGDDEDEEGEDGEPRDAGSLIDLEATDNGGDELFFEALRVVQSSKKASASLLQRQLKVGYARAARLLDIMEEKGIIGPADGAKPRQLFVQAKPESEIL
ncbi:MAG: DNA translocase FtsK 4TM domain-containing protein [Candidatus Peribacteraceae bacterium]|nr:DNA translocase FtsK 4TM domain-containing protein [Candidatus Peribacteraceae bacterium]